MNYFESPLINASTLKCFAGDDREYSQIQAIHRYKNFTPSKAMNLGSAIHHGIENIGRDVPLDEYEEFFTTLKTAKSRNENAKVVPEIINAFRSQAPVLAELVQNHPHQCELEFYGDKYKAKADFIYDGMIYDWKSCADTSYWGIWRSIKNLHYLIQAWLYREAIGAEGFTFVFIQNKEPFEIVYVPVTESMFRIGEHEAMIAESRFLDYKAGKHDAPRNLEFDFKEPEQEPFVEFDI